MFIYKICFKLPYNTVIAYSEGSTWLQVMENYCFNVQNLGDEIYAGRHEKPELDEKRRKRSALAIILFAKMSIMSFLGSGNVN